MALPTKEKTWQHNVNNVIGPYGTAQETYRTAFLTLKNALKGFAAGAWAVRGSSNSLTAANVGDGVDRIVVATDWVSGATDSTARSWIVLRQAGANNGELLFEGRSAGSTPAEQTMRIWWSPSGVFTGGSTTARPTAADEILLYNTANWISAANTPFQCVVHVMQSSDGACTRWVVHYNGKPEFFGVLDKLGDPVTGFTIPVFAGVSYVANNTVLLTQTLIQTSSPKFSASHGGVTFNVWPAAFASGSSLTLVSGRNAGQIKNGFDGSFPLLPMLLGSDTVPYNGMLGRICDWWLASELVMEGRTYPDDGSHKYVQFGHFVFPWNGTVAVLQ